MMDSTVSGVRKASRINRPTYRTPSLSRVPICARDFAFPVLSSSTSDVLARRLFSKCQIDGARGPIVITHNESVISTPRRRRGPLVAACRRGKYRSSHHLHHRDGPHADQRPAAAPILRKTWAPSGQCGLKSRLYATVLGRHRFEHPVESIPRAICSSHRPAVVFPGGLAESRR